MPESEARWANVTRNWEDWARFCAGFTVVVTVLFVAAFLLLKFLPAGIEVQPTSTGTGMIIKKADKPQIAVLMLPAMVEWLDTGIRLDDEHQAVCITTSGRVNLAIHRAVEAAQRGERPRVSWVDPDGNETYPKRLDETRKALLIMPSLPYGKVLAYIRPTGADLPSKTNPRPPGIQGIGSQGEARGKGELWLTVNDSIIKDDAALRKAFAGGDSQEVLDEAYGKGARTVLQEHERWDEFVRTGYWDALFADNAGDFLIQVDYSGKSCRTRGQ